MVHDSTAFKRLTQKFKKNFPSLLLAIKVDKNTYFLETCFAYTILELEFMV